MPWTGPDLARLAAPEILLMPNPILSSMGDDEYELEGEGSGCEPTMNIPSFRGV
jgi:hypothetical protein